MLAEEVRKFFILTLYLVLCYVGPNKLPDESLTDKMFRLDLEGGDLEEDEEDDCEGDEVSPDVDGLVVEPEHALQHLLGSVVPDPVPAFDEDVIPHERWCILERPDEP